VIVAPPSVKTAPPVRCDPATLIAAALPAPSGGFVDDAEIFELRIGNVALSSVITVPLVTPTDSTREFITTKSVIEPVTYIALQIIPADPSTLIFISSP
jgi:hypothetical protein